MSDLEKIEKNVKVFMTRFEQLIDKSLACLTAAKKTKGEMSKMWTNHAMALKEKAMALRVDEASLLV